MVGQAIDANEKAVMAAAARGVLPTPAVMGILNVTPDSFYAASRASTLSDVRERALSMAAEGADLIDVGACSTRPGSEPVTADEESARLLPALEAVREVLPAMPLSVDTFRPDVARMCVERFGPLLINDVSGGAAALPGVPYVLTCPDADPAAFFARRLPALAARGVTDVVLDPGFGFGKTLDDNWRLMARLDELTAFGRPLLVGVSRKSMLCRLLDVTPDDALAATTALHAFALQHGAAILRVHDVREAVQCVRIYRKLNE